MMSRAGKSAATSSRHIGFEYFEADAAAAGHAGADAGGAGVKQGDQPGLGDHVIQRVEGAVVGPERLRVGVELEPADAGLDQFAGFADGELPLVRVDARERDQHVRVLTRGFSTWSLPSRRRPMPASSSTQNTTAAILRSTIVVGDLLRRLAAAGAPPK